MGRQDRGDRRGNAGLPIDQGAVTVEADPLESVEVEHRSPLGEEVGEAAPSGMGVMESLPVAGETYGTAAHQIRIVAADEINAAGGVTGRRLEFLLKSFQSFAQCGDGGLDILPGGVDDDLGLPRFILPLAHLPPGR